MTYTYSDAKHYADFMKKNVKGLYITGSIRRKQETVSDYDFITKRHIQDIVEDFIDCMDDVEIVKQGLKYCSLVAKRGKLEFIIDVWRAGSSYEYFYKKLFHDLDKGHVIGLINKAKEAGYTISDTGLRLLTEAPEGVNGILVDIKNRKDLRGVIGL